MAPIKVMVNGLPGNMALQVARYVNQDNRFELLPASLTGPEITQADCTVDSMTVRLMKPDEREAGVAALKENIAPFICVDYTHPTAVNDNVDFYCRTELPFVMGTTGGDREQMVQSVLASRIPAVIAPNMAKQIVGFQAMMEYAAKTFPDLFQGYELEIRESHQTGKADTSGTAKAMVGYFNSLGVPFAASDIKMERDAGKQEKDWGVPTHYLTGHAWHTYTLISPEKTVKFQFKHNVNGRDIYALGTLDAIVYLDEKVREGAKGEVFSMIDVLKG